MRIAIITNSYPPRMGGLELHVENLAHGLSALGHETWVLTIAPEKGNREDGSVHVITSRSRFPVADVISFPCIGTTRSLTQFLKENHIDVVSTHTRFFPMSLVGQRAAHAAGIPVIHTEHGSGFVATPSAVIAAGSRAVDLTMGRHVLRHADRVLGVSPQAAAFAEYLGAAHADVFYNAIMPPAHGEPVADHPSHLVFVGRMVAGKGWDTFLDAVAAISERGSEVTGEMLGDGSDLDAARNRCTELGLQDRVSVRGRVTQEDVRKALRGATLVNPTILSEGFQTTLLEAVAEKGRVVTFDVPGACLLRDSGAPVTVCAQKSTQSLVESMLSALRSPQPLAPPELIEEWTWPVRAQEYAAIAREVLANHQRDS